MSEYDPRVEAEIEAMQVQAAEARGEEIVAKMHEIERDLEENRRLTLWRLATIVLDAEEDARRARFEFAQARDPELEDAPF